MTLDRRLAWSVFGLLLVSYVYFYHGGGWNENSRFDLVRAIVEDHSLAIDRFATNTGDKAFFAGHYYSDKAPGASLAAVPVYALFRLFRPLFHDEHAFLVVASWIVTIFASGLPGAVTGVLVYRATRVFGAKATGALIAALGYGLGTTAFPLSTMFFSHQLAALTLFASFFLAATGDKSLGRSAAVAALAATSVLVEFPTAPAAAAIVLFDSGFRLSRRTWIALAALAIPALGLGLYLTSAFGSPLHVGYQFLSDRGSREEMRHRGLIAFGLSYPNPAVMAELLLGRFRGLLPYSPILFLSIPGFLRALAGRSEEGGAHPVPAYRNAFRLALGVVIYFVLFVSSYAWWQGGASFGSRHLAPMLPFLSLPVAFVADARPRLAVVLGVVSVLFMTVVTSVQPKPSERFRNPLWQYDVPAFVRGDLALSNACPVLGSSELRGHPPFLRGRKRDAFNVGILLGGNGWKSLLPLLALWLTAGWALHKTLRDEDATRSVPALD